jgi:hypothetical protein
MASNSCRHVPTPCAPWISDSLNRRVPYPDPPFKQQHDPYEISLGNGHREIAHLIEIIADPSAPKASKIKALRLLTEVLPGRQSEALQFDAFSPLRSLIKNQRLDGLVLYSLVCLNTLVDTIEDAAILAPDIPLIVEILDAENEPPLRIAAATLLRHLADLLGPVAQFIAGNVPIKIVTAAASPLTTGDLFPQLFDLLSRLTNVQDVRVPLIANQRLLEVIVQSIRNPALQSKAVNLAENIAMDISHTGKKALLKVDILDEMMPLLLDNNVNTRMGALGLMALLAVPKKGKKRIAMAGDICKALKDISEKDADLGCRRWAYKTRIFVAELPFGKAIVGDVVDPSMPVRMATSELQLSGVKRANPKIADNPLTTLLSPRSRDKLIMATLAQG